MLHQFNGAVYDCAGVGFGHVEKARDVVEHYAAAVVHERREDRVGKVLDAVGEDSRNKDRHALCVFEARILEANYEGVLFWGKREGLLVFEKVWKGDAVYIAHDMVIHAVDEK